jgi:imidazoleglycerol-phosphate dehydratase
MGAAGTGKAQVAVRVEVSSAGAANVATGLSVLDYLVSELAGTARIQLSLEAAPGTVDEAVAAAGRAFGEALAGLLRAPGAAGYGWAWLPADEALAGAVIQISERPLVASNVDFSGQRVGGLGSDVVARFLDRLAAGAGLNVHIRVIEGKDPQHVLHAIFKALGAAIGQACRTPEGGEVR